MEGKNNIKLSDVENDELIEIQKVVNDFLNYLKSEYENIEKMEEERS